MFLTLPSVALPASFQGQLERSTVALTLTDAALPDHPIVAVNKPFVDITGYDTDAILGRNCRFLQPPGGAGPVRARIREFLASSKFEQARFIIPNQRRDGSPFINMVFMRKLFRGGGALVFASQFDITRTQREGIAAYEKALAADLGRIDLLLSEQDLMAHGTYKTLADSQALIAQARLDAHGEAATMA